MPRVMKERVGTAVSKLTKVGYHPIGGVAGLYMSVGPRGRSWILRLTVGNRRREMGLGSYPEVSHAKATERAKAARDLVRQGIDPIEQKRETKAALVAGIAKAMTFDQCCVQYIASHAAGWRSIKHADQWRTTLSQYASPVIGNLSVAHVETGHVIKILTPLWTTRTETATRLRGRIERVLGWATTIGYRGGENPARWAGHLENLLPKPSKLVKVEHHAALPWQEIGTFMAELRQRTNVGARALEFLILTASRSGEARGAAWSEIDLQTRIWTVPASRMKAEAEHRVPLSDAAMALLEALPRMAGTDFVFPNSKGRAMTDMALAGTLQRMKVPVTTHGFRSTFRDWCSESTNYPREVAEQALAHKIPNLVEAAYRRGDLLEKRARLMQEWADYCGRVPAVATVTPINASAAVAA